MLRYHLRTLLIVLALGPPLIAAGWWGWGKWRDRQERLQVEREIMRMWELSDSTVINDPPLMPGKYDWTPSKRRTPPIPVQPGP
jgi:hypothetical protein